MGSASDRLARLWRRTHALPGGRWLFSRVFDFFVPYTGTIGATVDELAPGRAIVRLRDRRAVRNHLDSIHAVALINLGELASGLAMTMALPADVRGIVTSLGADYLKKARGPLVARSDVTLPAIGSDPVECPVVARIEDQSGAEVCRVRAVWRLERRAA
jgi:acyl-coenzyme A thioesterase PaaI-like protein